MAKSWIRKFFNPEIRAKGRELARLDLERAEPALLALRNADPLNKRKASELQGAALAAVLGIRARDSAE